MKPEQLIEYFDRISEAPDAVSRLRCFIFDLAVRGKLVELDPNDPPALELLKEIEAEKKRQIKAGKIKKSKSLPAIDQSDASYVLPKNWVWTRLGTIGNIFNGNSINAREKETKYAGANGFPYIATKDVGYGLDALDYNNGIYIPKSEEKFKIAHQGAVLICAEGGSAGKKCGITEQDICFGNKLFANELFGGIPPKFILYLYLSPVFRESFNAAMTGIIGGVSIAKFLELPVPLAPIAEQHRIVAKVDELMALCDQLEAAKSEREAQRDRLVAASLHRIGTAPAITDEVETEAKNVIRLRDAARFHLDHLPRLTTRPEHIKQLRQTILDLAVRGRIVPHDTNDEEPDALLSKIRLEQHRSIKLGIMKSREHSIEKEESGGLYQIPDEWCWARLADLITFGPQNGISPKEVKDDRAPKALTLTATTSGIFNAEYYKHVELSQRDCESYWLYPGDVLFQRGNTREYVGMAAIFDGPAKEYIFPDLMIRVRFSNSIDNRFAHMVMVSPPLREYFSSNATGASTTMPKINQSVLLNAPFPLPPLSEQSRIVAKVGELMALCDQLEAQLAATQTDSRRLLEAVLHEALTPVHKEVA